MRRPVKLNPEEVSVLFNEPKLLKWWKIETVPAREQGFSALQRAEIAEMPPSVFPPILRNRFSALQRAEIAEMTLRLLLR